MLVVETLLNMQYAIAIKTQTVCNRFSHKTSSHKTGKRLAPSDSFAAVVSLLVIFGAGQKFNLER